jgi:hypothetical protein
LDDREVDDYLGPGTTRRENGLGGDGVPVEDGIGPGGNCSCECHRESHPNELLFHNVFLFVELNCRDGTALSRAVLSKKVKIIGKPGSAHVENS